MQYYALQPRYDARQSFYGKALVFIDEQTGSKMLHSYGTHVATITGSDAVVLKDAHPQALSQTTLRHIKEFLKQNGFNAESKAQIVEDYCK